MEDKQYLFSQLKPVLLNDLIRIGNKDGDGGYILSKRQIEYTNVLIGLGISYDWTFEKEMKDLNTNLTLYCYDFSVGESKFLKKTFSYLIDIVSLRTFLNLFKNFRAFVITLSNPIKELNTYFSFRHFFNKKRNIFFFQKGISNNTSDIFIQTSEMFNNIPDFKNLADNSVYLKIDIEGSEYVILEDIIRHNAKINGLVIEFHDLNLKWNIFNSIILKLKTNFAIIHVHANNCCGCINETQIPNVVEISFMKKELISAGELNSQNLQSYPLSHIDKQNMPNKVDLELNFDWNN